MHRGFMKVSALVITSCLLISELSQGVQINAATQTGESTDADDTGDSDTSSELLEYSNERIDHNYTVVSAQYTYPEYTGETLTYEAADIYTDGTAELTTETLDYGKASQVISAEDQDEVTLTIEVPESAIYYINFDYVDNSTSILPAEASMEVNGEITFYEMRRQVFEGLWVSGEEKDYDSYGNEIVGIPDKLYEWQNKYVMDASYRYMSALGVELTQGSNTITLSLSEGSLLLGDVSLTAKPEVAEYSGSNTADGDAIIQIEAEEFDARNDSSIHAACEYNPDLYPYSSNKRVLNTIDSDSFEDAGQKVTYEYSVETSGTYNLAFNYSQSDKSDFPVFMNIEIDGQLVNTEFENYAFAYSKDYDMLTLTDEDGNNLTVDLEEGTHTISLQISMEPLRVWMERIDEIMNEVNDLSLEVTKVVGTNKDKYRDFSLESYIPGVADTMTAWADELDQIMEEAKAYNPSVKKIAAFSNLSIASSQLRSLAKDPDELLYRIDELSTSVTSVNRQLANLVDSINTNNFSLDSIYLYQDGAKSQLPKATSIFKKIGCAVVRFFSSFGEQAYSTSDTNPEHLQVWVNRSRQHLEIMQEMIDEEFTKETGIEVDLSLMPDQTKLVLSNASGDSPDIATGINYSIPFELGIRGAIKDLTEFDDFAEVAGQYSEGLMVPYVIGDGIYALPETMTFQVLFYREDVLEKLGLSIPDTLEDVEAMLPDLQMRGLNFYYPTSRTVGIKTFLDTTPILFQSGAQLYDQYAENATLNSEAMVEGFTTLTNLFTIYNLPKDVPNFYQHFRIGDYPIGISDFTTYNLLVNAAPEIDGSWGIALLPGIENDDGEVLRYSSSGAESTVMFNSTEEREEESWEFMKWWSSAEVQAEFGQRLQITYGEEYYWNTANAEAFAQLPWDSDDKEVILEQMSWIMEAPRALASYMVERELSDAYNLVALNGENVREALDTAQKNVTRETERKLEEFGYMEDGEIIKEYEIPTVEKVKEILGESD